MKSYEFQQYYVPACENIFGKLPYFSNEVTEEEWNVHHRQLDNALGTEMFIAWAKTPSMYDQPLTDQEKALLVLLAGKFGKTILKVYQIKKTEAVNDHTTDA